MTSEPTREIGSLLDDLLFLSTSAEIRTRLGQLARSDVEELARTSTTIADDLRARGKRAEASLHERVAHIVRAHLEETTTNLRSGPAHLLTESLDHPIAGAPRLDRAHRRAPGPPGVFISYSRRDQAYVDALATHLSNAGLPVWVDRQRMPAGARITKEIRAAIVSCPAFLLVLSNASAESDWVDDEDNWARAHGRLRIALRLDGDARWFSVAGLNIVDVTDRSMPSDDVIETLRTAVREHGGPAAERTERLEEASRWIDAGIAHQEAHDFDRAEQEYQRALQQYEACGSTAGIAAAYHQLGIVSELRNDLDGALEHYRRSVELIQILRDEGEDHDVAPGHAQIGQIRLKQSDFPAARESMTMALQLRRLADDVPGEASSLHDLATLHGTMLGQHFDSTTGSLLDNPEARELLQLATDYEKQALRLYSARRDREGIARTTAGLGRLAWMADELDDAEVYLAQSLNINEALGRREQIANTLVVMAKVKLERGRFDQAVPMLLRSLAIREALGASTLMENVEVLAVLQAKLGRPRLVRLAQRDGLTDALATFDDMRSRSD